MLANACGPCIGQWKRQDIKQGEENTILNSYNRNFPRRNDGKPRDVQLHREPRDRDGIGLWWTAILQPDDGDVGDVGRPKGKAGGRHPPAENGGLPAEGFAPGLAGFVEPAEDGSQLEVLIDPKSQRLQRLEPFSAWDGKDYEGLVVLLKAEGKCTTDHISPAGPWLRFRGHLDKISDNMFLGANNAFTEKAGTAVSMLTGEKEVPIANLARAYKAKGIGWGGRR